ncbi:MAG: hypothetical protein JXR07_08010 [Reichenbachiella sp.]
MVLNDRLESQATFEDLSISVFKEFPNLTITFKNIQIEEDTYEILKAGKLELQFNPLEFIKRNYILEKVLIINTTYNVEIDSLGNKHEIRGKPAPPKPARDLSLDIPEIVIKNSMLKVHNRFKKNRQVFAINDALLSMDSYPNSKVIRGSVNGSLDTLISKGDFISTDFSLKIENAIFRFNTLEGRKRFNGHLSIGNANLRVDGSLSPAGNGNLAKIVLQSNKAHLDNYFDLLSVLNPLGLRQINPEALIELKIGINGFIDPKSYPGVDIDFEVSDAVIHKEGLYKPLENVQLHCNYSNGKDRTAATSSIYVEKGNATLEDNFLSFHGRIENFDDPLIDMIIESKIDLKEIKPLFNFSKNRKMSGLLEIDAFLQGRLSDLERSVKNKKRRYEGDIQLTDVYMDFPEQNHFFEKINGSVVLRKKVLALESINGKYNSSDFTLDGNIHNLMPLLSKVVENDAEAYIDFYIDRLNIPDSIQSSNKSFQFPEYLTLNLNINSNEIYYQNYELKDIYMNGRFNRNEMNFKSLLLKFDDTEIDLIGSRTLLSNQEEISLVANIGKIDLEKYIDKTVNNETSTTGKFDLSNVKFNAEINLEELIYQGEEFRDIELSANLENENTSINQLQFDFPYGRLSSNAKIEGINELKSIDAEVNLDMTSFEINDLKAFFLHLFPSDSGESENAIFLDDEIDLKLKLDIASPAIEYDSLFLNDLNASFSVNNGIVVISAIDFHMFKGPFNIRGFVDDRSSNDIGAMIYLNANDIALSELLSELEPSQKQLFSEESFKGTMDVEGELLLIYDKRSLEHQEDELIGKVKIVLNEAEIIKFTPITESLKFIKKEVRENIQLDNQDFEILFHNDEMVIPQTRFSSNLSNIEFIGYHSKDFDFGFDIRISAGDLLFKSQKKKQERVKKKDTSFGRLNTYLSARGEKSGMKIKKIKKTKYQNDIKLLTKRYTYVDSVIHKTKSQLIDRAMAPN